LHGEDIGMGKMQRAKGASGERELAQALYDELGVRLARRLEQSRAGGFDLSLAPDQTGPVAAQLARYAIEIKRHAKAPAALVRSWWRQAEAQASAAGLVPVLAYRPDRGAWRFVLPLVELHPDLTRAPGVEFTAELSLVGFAAVIREIAA
jgi:Holliday junction resolvase